MPHDAPSRAPLPRRAPPVHLAGALSLATCLCLAACAPRGLPFFDGPRERTARGCQAEAQDAELYRSAQRHRTERLEREIDHLRADLRQAEEAMVAIESGLRGPHTRADAVSALAEARIAVESAVQSAPWRAAKAREARGKLEEAERQLQAGHTGSAVFFASRARRIADDLNEEAGRVAHSPDARFIHSRRANLRAGPSTEDRVIEVLDHATPVFPERQEGDWVLVRTPAGPVGWIHASLIRAR